MLKVKVEQVEASSLYEKVALPNNPLTIAGYQVYCNDEDRQDEKVPKLIHHEGQEEEEEVHVHPHEVTDTGIEGTDRMMTECCAESDLMVGDLVSGVVPKEDDGLQMGEYLENDVMVDNNIVEEQVVEDGMVLVSSVTHDVQDGIEVPYMETTPAEVLVIEEGAELMVDNIHGIPHMVIDEEHREYLIPAHNTEHQGSTGPVVQEEGTVHMQEAVPQGEHVVVERISYEMPIIQSGNAPTQYFIPQVVGEEQSCRPVSEPMIGVVEERVPQSEVPAEAPMDTLKPQKHKKHTKKDVKSEVTKRKKPPKRKSEETDGFMKTAETTPTKSKTRRKSGQPESSKAMHSTPPRQQTIPNPNEKSTKVSPIQANHPTLSLLLSKKGPMELFGPSPSPMETAVETTESTSEEMPVESTPETRQQVPGSPKSTPKVAAVVDTPVSPRVMLPEVVTQINKEVLEKTVPTSPKETTLTINASRAEIEHSTEGSKGVSPPAVAQDLSLPKRVTQSMSPLHTVLATKSPPQISKVAPAEKHIVTSSVPILQPPIAHTKSMTPLTVAVADTLAIASLPSTKPASVLTIPKPMRRINIETTPSPTSRALPLISSPALALVPNLSPVQTAMSPPSVAVPPVATLPASSKLIQSPESLVSPIQKKYQLVTTTLQAKLAVKPNIPTSNGMETLADRYMKEWKPTGRFQCKLCLYSCVTHNFLFRHWVLNHCSLRPYMCGHCGFQSATRDGVTRHQTAKHRGLARRIFIDNEQQELLWNKFEEMFQGSGFVTELERQAQASYTFANTSTTTPDGESNQLDESMQLDSLERAQREEEIVTGTILKVPKRGGVSKTFREAQLPSADDHEPVTSLESGEDDDIELAGRFRPTPPTGYVRTYSAQSVPKPPANLTETSEIAAPQNDKKLPLKKSIAKAHQASELRTAAETERIYQFITAENLLPSSKLSGIGDHLKRSNQENDSTITTVPVQVKAAKVKSMPAVSSLCTESTSPHSPSACLTTK